MVKKLLFTLAIQSSHQPTRKVAIQLICWLERRVINKQWHQTLQADIERKATRVKVLSLTQRLNQRLKIHTLTFLLNQQLLKENVGKF